MTDAQFRAAFESLTLPPEEFSHRAHVRLAWIYLGTETLLAAVDRFVRNLRRFATHHGSSGRYHETITLALLFLIHDRMVRHGRSETWEEFAARNGDLFSSPTILENFYRRETLQSDLAKQSFLFPDRVPQAT